MYTKRLLLPNYFCRCLLLSRELAQGPKAFIHRRNLCYEFKTLSLTNIRWMATGPITASAQLFTTFADLTITHAQLPPPTTQLLHSTTTPTIDGNMNADGIVHSQLHGAAMNEGQRVEHPKNQVSSPPTQTTMLGGSTTMVPLADPLDEATLSSGSVLLRKQIELFEATEADVADRKSKGGLISVQQVGIRCIHCAHLPFAECARGAASFPTSIQL